VLRRLARRHLTHCRLPREALPLTVKGGIREVCERRTSAELVDDKVRMQTGWAWRKLWACACTGFHL